MTNVSVIIPVKNEAENIRPLIDGIIAAMQPRGDFDVIVVNDGSTDNSSDVLKEAM